MTKLIIDTNNENNDVAPNHMDFRMRIGNKGTNKCIITEQYDAVVSEWKLQHRMVGTVSPISDS